MAKTTKLEHLDLLISSQEDLKSRKCLTDTGVAYLDGMKRAREIMFPTKKEEKK